MTISSDRRCVVVCGSTKADSRTRAVSNVMAERLRQAGFAVSFIDTRQLVLPIADPEFHHSPDQHPEPAVRELSSTFDAAQAVVLASPVYHGSYSGVLKNLLDHLRWDAFARRPVGLIVHGGNPLSGTPVCDHLRSVVRTMAGYATQSQVVSGPADISWDDRGTTVLAEPVQLRIDRMAAELVELSVLLSRPRTKPTSRRELGRAKDMSSDGR